MGKIITKIMATLLLGTFFIGSISVRTAKSETINSHVKIGVEEVNIATQPSTLLKNIGTMSIKENLVVEDKSVPLYVTFDSQEQALKNISENIAIETIKDVYGYNDLSKENWRDYYSAMYELLDSPLCPAWYNEEDADFRTIRQFFDIYENEDKNIEILSLVASAKTVDDVTKNVNVLELLPYNSYDVLTQESQCFSNEQALTAANNSVFNINSGVNYATNYATSPNTADYDKFSSDCTNFVSQILENGGVAQDVYNDETKGWWHTKSNVLFVTTHKHSISWIRADSFAKYMGVGFSTSNNSSFSYNIKRGDFIAADFDNDGDWNHMGFVTDVHAYVTDGYYDYKVAQHTKDYHEWASSTTNGWEKIGADGGLYGRVRR